MANHPINHQIRGDKVLLVIDSGEHKIVSKREALALADENNLDLIQVDNRQNTPVCRMMDYKKFLYEQKKSAKKSKPVHQKEIKMRLGTAEQDFNLKVKKIAELLEKGCHVKVTIVMQGREHHFRNDAVSRLKTICEMIETASSGNVEHSGDTVSVKLTPSLKKVKQSG